MNRFVSCCNVMVLAAVLVSGSFVSARAEGPSGTLVVRNQTDATISVIRNSYLGSETVIPPDSVVVLDGWLKTGNTSVQVNALCVEGTSGYTQDYWVSGEAATTQVLVVNPDNFGKSIMFDKPGCGVAREDAAEQARCLAYAQKAMAQLSRSMDLKCRFKGAKWSRKRQEHLDWCLTVGPEQAAAMERARDEEMAQCVANKEKAPWCEEYAMESVLQYQRAVDGNCRQEGTLWSGDYGTHYDFCMNFSQNRTQNELGAREAQLAECAEQKERDGFCKDYAARAQKMYRASLDMKCDFTGADWSDDFDDHYEYCLQATDEYAEQYLAACRQAKLDKCREQWGAGKGRGGRGGPLEGPALPGLRHHRGGAVQGRRFHGVRLLGGALEREPRSPRRVVHGSDQRAAHRREQLPAGGPVSVHRAQEPGELTA